MTSLSLLTNSFSILLKYKNTALILIAISFVISAITQWFANKIQAEIVTSTAWVGYIVTIILSIIIGAAIAVAWHRRVLLDEELSISSKFLTAPAVWSYLLGVLILIGLYIIGAIAVGIIGGIIGGILASTGAIFLLVILAPFLIVVIAILMIMFMRISLILPARAVEKKISVREALNATKGANWIILGYALLLALIGCIIMFPYISIVIKSTLETGVTPVLSPLMIGFIAIIGAILGMTQIGAMTLLYAHYVKN